MSDVDEIVLALDPGVDFAIARFVDRKLHDAAFQDSPWDQCDVLVVEFPHVRKNGNADPNAIVRLAWAGGEIAGAIDYVMRVEVPTVSIPKSIVQARVLLMLEDFERENLTAALKDIPRGKHHNVFDAVRHGLVYLGRLRA